VIIGYARVSTEDQHLDAQASALEAIGADRIFAEKISGTKKAQPDLDRMIEQLRDGDLVVVTKYAALAGRYRTS
jgi:DNA invertase Pin-like site-specific DNA recombinase